MIEIRQVESDSAGRVLTGKRKLICNLIPLFSLAVLFGGVVLGL